LKEKKKGFFGRKKVQIPTHFREIVLGEHDLGLTKDCDSKKNCLPPIQKRFPAETKIHEGWVNSNVQAGNDIALIRMDKPVILAFVSRHNFLMPYDFV